MGRWKAGPEKPRTKFCWVCSRRLHGRVHMRIRTLTDGAEHDIHKACARSVGHHQWETVYESSTTGEGAARPVPGTKA